MQELDTTQAVGVKGQPLMATSFKFSIDGLKQVVSVLASLQTDPISTNVALSGLTVTGTVIADGWAWIGGELYFVTGDDFSGYSNVAVLIEDFTFDGLLDPITFSDGSTGNVHVVRALKIADQMTGTGVVDYGNLKIQRDHSLIKKTINIGDWNMDSTGTLSIAHGLTLADIRNIQIQIREDAGVNLIPLNYKSDGWWSADGTNVNMGRLGAGTFDAVAFDSTGFNRGFILIEYYTAL